MRNSQEDPRVPTPHCFGPVAFQSGASPWKRPKFLGSRGGVEYWSPWAPERLD